MVGVIYVLSNPALPNLLKIGLVKQYAPGVLKKRINALQAGSPYPYRVEHAACGEQATEAEKELHLIHSSALLDEGGGKEWFKLGLPAAKKTLEKFEGLTVLTDDQLATLTNPVKHAKAARSLKGPSGPSLFEQLGLRVEDALSSGPGGSICRVFALSPSLVKFDGEVMTISSAAYRLKGYRISGARFWRHNGKTLKALRDALPTSA